MALPEWWSAPLSLSMDIFPEWVELNFIADVPGVGADRHARREGRAPPCLAWSTAPVVGGTPGAHFVREKKKGGGCCRRAGPPPPYGSIRSEGTLPRLPIYNAMMNARA